MPKIKTHRGAAKRFSKTGTGKYKGFHSFHRHILGKKSAKRKMELRKSVVVNAADQRVLEKLLPY